MYLSPKDKQIVNGPDSLFSIMQSIYKRELKINRTRLYYCWILALNEEYRLFDLALMPQKQVNEGTLTKERVFKNALYMEAKYLIIVQTSLQKNWAVAPDMLVLKDEIKTAGEVINIPLLEYMLINEDGYYSLGENGKL